MRVREAELATDYDALRAIRFAVFVDEQHVPPELEMDERDAACRHFVVLDEAGAALATGRIDLDKAGKIGRVAVLAHARGRGIGTRLMGALHDAARAHGLASVWCNAQISAAPFYTKLGYRVVGDSFEEAGIEHVRMEREL
jgi:predicted GNAT family N-acyltransferase